jgi:hypothetical protein
LICYTLQVLVYKHFQLFHLPCALATMTWRVRRELGIAYLRNGTPTQLPYTQLLDMFHDLARTFDALVVAEAISIGGGMILTGDPDDLSALADRATGIEIMPLNR